MIEKMNSEINANFNFWSAIIGIILGVAVMIFTCLAIVSNGEKHAQAQELNQSVKVFKHSETAWVTTGQDGYDCVNAKVEYDERTDEYTCTLIFKKILEE